MKNSLSEIKKLIKFSTKNPLNTTFRKKLKTIQRIIKWTIVSRIHNGSIITQFIENKEIALQKGISARETYFHMLNEPYEMAFLLHTLSSDCIFIDVGANAGVYTILACTTGSYVIALEPAQKTYDLLLKNIRLNDYSNQVTPLKLAAGPIDGPCHMKASSGPTNRIVALSKKTTIETETTSMTTLDNLIDDGNKFYVIKIDVEGYEDQVLEGAKNSLKKDNILAIIIESTGNSIHFQKNDFYAENILLEAGFKKYAYNPTTREITPLIKRLSENIIFIKNENLAQERTKKAKKYNIGDQEI